MSQHLYNRDKYNGHAVIKQNPNKNTTCLIISKNGQPNCPIKLHDIYCVLL